jgi:hypothetical protein
MFLGVVCAAVITYALKKQNVKSAAKRSQGFELQDK